MQAAPLKALGVVRIILSVCVCVCACVKYKF